MSPKMNFILMPKLEDLALNKIASILWTCDMDSIAKRIDVSYLNQRNEEWKRIESEISEKASKLSIPERLKNMLIDLIHPFGSQIFKWKECHDYKFGIYAPLPRCFYWTSQGFLDKRRIALALVKDETLDIIKRYKMACIYCFEKDINELWNKIPIILRQQFCETLEHTSCINNFLIAYWTHVIKNEMDKLQNIIIESDLTMWNYPFKTVDLGLYQYAFENAAFCDNLAAAEYFLPRLTPHEREASLARTTKWVISLDTSLSFYIFDYPFVKHTQMLCYLFANMSEEQELKVLENCAYGVMKSFLEWPWQNFFLKIASLSWDFLNESRYEKIALFIVNKISFGHTNFNYRKLFGDFWRQSPSSLKKYLIAECSSNRILLLLFKAEDVENLGLIFDDATYKEKENIIFSRESKYLCLTLLVENKWELLKFFLRECLPWKNRTMKFTKEFEVYMRKNCIQNDVFDIKYKWDEFLLENGLIWKYKRKCVSDKYVNKDQKKSRMGNIFQPPK